MPDPVTGVLGAVSVGSSLLSSRSETRAIDRATEAQVASSDAGIAAVEAARLRQEEILAPYVAAGTGGEGVTGSLQATQALLGLLGEEEQANAISAIESGAEFQALSRQGEDAILQNASATGGLRGGNVQGALAQFRPALLNQTIDQQFRRLGGLNQIGQASAAGVGAAGINSGGSIAELLRQQGEAIGSGAIARGQSQSDLISGIGKGVGLIAGGF